MELKFGIFDWIEAPANRTAAELYAHKLALAQAADQAGFHAYLVAEHQGTPLSINAQPSVLLSAMIQRTTRLRVGALTFCLPWYNPYRLYNEVCMLDQLSRGRLEMGVGRGVSPIESKIFGLAAHHKWASRIHHLVHKVGRPEHHKTDPYAPDSVQPLVTGSPRNVLEKLQAMLELTSANYLLCIFSFGDLAPEHAMRSLQLFAEEVVPRLKISGRS